MNEFPELDLATVKGRAVKGVITLTGRTAILQIISFFGFFFLTVFLGVAQIGIFFAISELVAILGYFSDIGLAAALIQKKEKLEVVDIRTTFTVQQILVLTLSALTVLLTPFLRDFYHISQEGIYLLWALVFGFITASLKTIPSVLLERALRFDLLVIVEIVETLLFYGLAVFLAWQGWGILSYVWAVVIRGLVGAVLIYIISPWDFGFALKLDSLRGLLRFGLPYQANSFLAVVKDRLMNVILWKIIGAEGVGILGWAQKWSQTPLRFAMDAVMKVTFPAFSRLQDNEAELKKGIEKSLLFISLITFPALAGMVLLSSLLVEVIPKYGKWSVALVALGLYAVNSAFAAVTTPLTNALSAIGKINLVFKLMVMWTALTWAIYPLLALRFGYNGVAAGAAVVSVSSVVAIILARRYLVFDFWEAVKNPVIATVGMAIVLWLLKPLVSGLSGLVVLIFVGMMTYLLLLWPFLGRKLMADVRAILTLLALKNDERR